MSRTWQEPLLRGKLGRRIFVLFLFASLLPLTLNTVLSSSRLSAELVTRGLDELSALSRSQAQEVDERLKVLEAQLQITASGGPLSPQLSQYFQEIWFLRAVGEDETTPEWRPLLRDLVSPRSLDRLGEATTVSLLDDPSGMLLLGIPELEAHANTGSRALWAAVDSDWLWWGELRAPVLPRDVSMTFFGAEQRVLHTTTPLDEQPVLPEFGEGSSHVTWTSNGQSNDGHRWILLLPRFDGMRELTVLAWQANDTLTAPAAQLNLFFAIAVLTALFSVLFITLMQLRRRLEPLETLRHATQQLARREFTSPIKVSSDDELQELAESFNVMATRLESQFQTLEASRDITELMLSSSDERQLVTTALRRLGNERSCRGACLTLALGDSEAKSRTFVLEGDQLVTELSHITRDLIGDLDLEQSRYVGSPEELPPFGAALRNALPGYLCVQVISTEHQPTGIVSTILDELPAPGDNSIDQLAKLIGVALINLNQMRQLRGYSRQSLAALARAVDMKSAWTRGHSDRVARLARAVGENLGLDIDRCETLWRAGIVHDIGKISVPRTILDKPGPLDEEEIRVIQQHVDDGLQILEPLAHLKPTLTFVREHHERLDGSGYPLGLSGSQISLDGRIAAVVDSFDALTSPRPYRAQLSVSEALEELSRTAGVQYDQKVLDALVAVTTSSDVDEAEPPEMDVSA